MEVAAAAQIPKGCPGIKKMTMKRPKRDLLVVVNKQFLDEWAIEREVTYLHEMLLAAESKEHFCRAHELVDRNRITRKPPRILKAIRFSQLKPFRFLLNRN